MILRVPVAPALAALVFIGAFVPLVGAFVSGFVAVAVAFVAVGWVQGLLMFAAIILVMQVEGHILQPLLLGRAVKLHPLAVLLAIAIGIIIGGIVGALVAVPILAFTKSLVQYLMGAPDPGGGPAQMAKQQPTLRRGRAPAGAANAVELSGLGLERLLGRAGGYDTTVRSDTVRLVLSVQTEDASTAAQQALPAALRGLQAPSAPASMVTLEGEALPDPAQDHPLGTRRQRASWAAAAAT